MEGHPLQLLFLYCITNFPILQKKPQFCLMQNWGLSTLCDQSLWTGPFVLLYTVRFIPQAVRYPLAKKSVICYTICKIVAVQQFF